MKSALIVVAIVVVVVLALAFSCPDEASFHRHINKIEARDSGNLIDEAKDALLAAQTKVTADYNDHVLWATVDARRGTDGRRYLGAMGMWFELDSR